MQIIEPDSVLSIQCDFTLSSIDEEVLACLYLPIIKNQAFALYHCFLALSKISIPYFSHEEVLNYTGLKEAEFLQARMNLEGMGLLETYRKKEKRDQQRIFYSYHLFAPNTPMKFFADPLYRPLFSSIVGKKKYLEIASYFKSMDNFKKNEFINVSANFKDIYFSLIEENSIQVEDISENLITKEIKPSVDFSFDELEAELKNNSFSLKLNGDDKEMISNTILLYQVSIPTAAKLIVDSTSLEGSFYSTKFVEKCRQLHSFTPEETTSGENVAVSGKVKKYIDALNSTTPQDYLFNRFQLKQLPKYMYEEIEKLKNDFDLTNEMITLIIDYSLKKTSNSFNGLYMEKVAASLKANKVLEPYQAMVYLNTHDFEKIGKRKKTSSNKKVEQEEIMDEEDISRLKDELNL